MLGEVLRLSRESISHEAGEFTRLPSSSVESGEAVCLSCETISHESEAHETEHMNVLINNAAKIFRVFMILRSFVK